MHAMLRKGQRFETFYILCTGMDWTHVTACSQQSARSPRQTSIWHKGDLQNNCLSYINAKQRPTRPRISYLQSLISISWVSIRIVISQPTLLLQRALSSALIQALSGRRATPHKHPPRAARRAQIDKVLGRPLRRSSARGTALGSTG